MVSSLVRSSVGVDVVEFFKSRVQMRRMTFEDESGFFREASRDGA